MDINAVNLAVQTILRKLKDPASSVTAALNATYARVITSDGSNQTAAINAALSATSLFRKSVTLVGSFTITAPLVVPSNTTLNAEQAVITLAAGSNCNMVTNPAVLATTTRDSGIIVRGGAWDRGTNVGSGTGMHTMMFRRVDGIRVTGHSVTTGAGKYAINLGAVTDFEVDHITFSTSSDGVHINGPASGGRIYTIRGTTHDDSVALTGNDYTAYADVTGNITDVEISDVFTTSTGANNVKALAGQNCTIDDIRIRRVRGLNAQNGVWLGDDNGQAVTDNGTHGSIYVDDVNVQNNVAAGSANAAVFGNLANGAKRLVLRDIVLSGGLANYAVCLGIDAAGVIDSLSVERVTVADGLSGRRAVRIASAVGGKINDLEIRGAVMRNVTSAVLLDLAATNVVNARIVAANLLTSDTATNWVSVNSSSALGKLIVSGGQISGGKNVANLSVPTTLILTGGLVIPNIDRLVNQYVAAITVVLGEVIVQAVTNRLFMQNATSTGLTVFVSTGAMLPASPTLAQRSAAEPIRITGPNAVADPATLTPLNEDVIKLEAAKGTIAAGATAVYRAGTWKDLYAGTSYTP